MSESEIIMVGVGAGVLLLFGLVAVRVLAILAKLPGYMDRQELRSERLLRAMIKDDGSVRR